MFCDGRRIWVVCLKLGEFLFEECDCLVLGEIGSLFVVVGGGCVIVEGVIDVIINVDLEVFVGIC